MNKNRARDGKYDYEGKWDRICALCGNTLGAHLAEKPHPMEEGLPSINLTGRYCEGFKPQRKVKG